MDHHTHQYGLRLWPGATGSRVSDLVGVLGLVRQQRCGLRRGAGGRLLRRRDGAVRTPADGLRSVSEPESTPRPRRLMHMPAAIHASGGRFDVVGSVLAVWMC
jgi:hypothetical protein